MTAAPFSGPLAEAFSAVLGGSGTIDAAQWRSILLSPALALPIAPASDRSVWDVDSGAIDHASAAAILDRARTERGSIWPQPRASDAARVHRDGDRDAFEQAVFARQQRLSRAAVAAAVTLKDAWIDEVVDGVWMLCEQSSWCWPAHDDTFARHGSVLATVDDPYLDLGAGEVVAQLAWIDQLLGAQLDERAPGVRKRIRHETQIRIFTPFVERRDWHWIGLDGDAHNWNPWIHGNVLTAALRLLDDPSSEQARAGIVALCVEGLDRYVASLPADGAIDEGYSYWWNGACRALEALDILRGATTGQLDAVSTIAALRETIAFPHRMHLGREWYLNLADGQARPPAEQPWHSLHRAALTVGDDAARAHAAAHRERGVASEKPGLGRLLRALTDPEWIDAAPASVQPPRDVWLPSTAVLVAREWEGDTRGLTLAVKGGHNGENHNHNDVGSFVVASDGVPVIVDAGRPTYTAQTFGPDRYDIWTMQSTWHNVPEIDGQPQSPGAAFAAREVSVHLGDTDSALELELAGAYDLPTLRTWRRTARLERAHGRVVISDAWDLDAASTSPTIVRMLIAGRVSLFGGGAAVVPLEGARPLRLRWPVDVSATAVVRELDDPMLSQVWGARLTRIDLDVTARFDVQVTVERDQATVEGQA